MMRYMKNNSESGVALIFAIGLLALLLLVGLAFVGNSINYRKVAENNSSRSQARMLALSAASRAASSLQIYSHQFIKNDSSHEPPKSFDHIFSFARYDADGAVSSGGAYEYNDGLVGDYSLMLLPTGSSVLSSQRALAFNNQFLNNWPGRWVFFTNGLTGDDRRIIGRAAWQVVGSPAEILAPVFMRGAVTVDPYYSGSGSEIFYPNKHRWGREIDEVVLPDSVFLTAGITADGRMSDMSTVYPTVSGASGTDEDAMRIQRWIESWFVPDYAGGTVADPSETTFTETYAVGRYHRLRFNISELNDGGHEWQENRDGDPVYEGLDQWYARLGITSTNKADANSETAIIRLTADAPYFMDHSDKFFDYEIFGSDVSDGDREFGGLPFLRRIGHNKGTFTSLTDLRKQIAANFNDYCDTDGIPTSNVAADSWLKLLGSTTKPNPAYTGNELTPYLYEIGMNFGLASSDSASDIVSATKTDAASSEYTIGMEVLAAPIVKLCNIYPFDPDSGTYSNFGSNADFLRAYVDFGQLDIKFRLRQVQLRDVEFSYKVTIVTVTETKTQTGTDVNGDPVYTTTTQTDEVVETRTFKVDAITLKNLNPASGTSWYSSLGNEFEFNSGSWERTAATAVNPDTPIDPVVFSASDVDNSSGSNPYPWKRGASGDAMWQKALPATALTFNYTLEKDDLFDVYVASADVKSDVVIGVVTGTGTYSGDMSGYQYALYGYKNEAPPTTTTPDSKTTVTTTVTTTYDTPEIKTQPSAITVDQIAVTNVDFAGIRRAILTANAGGKEVGVDFVGALTLDLALVVNQDVTFPDAADDTDYTMPGYVLGSFRNYDPRQNLNSGDWLGLSKALWVDDIYNFATTVNVDGIALLSAGVDDDDDDGVNKTNDPAADGTLFVPFPAVADDDDKDYRDEETVDQPAYRSATQHISTAVIRNAPMMSPWEIGFIHRGIMWQTINIKRAEYTDFADNGDSWDKTGSNYSTHGDGAILEQIKMSDRIRSYGKININRLRSGDTHFADNITQNLGVAQSLFTGLVYGDDPLKFIINSTRDASTGRFPDTAIAGDTDKIDTAQGITCASNFAQGLPAREEYSRRIAFLNYETSAGLCLENAFSSTVSFSQTTDAAQEEIIGKTINLLSAHRSSPNLVYVVVVAQSIRDRAGEQVQLTTETVPGNFNHPYSGSVDIDDGVVTMQCQYGRFDYLHHTSKDPGQHIYFDEITGEVKMFVQLYHDTTTGRLTILKIDYL